MGYRLKTVVQDISKVFGDDLSMDKLNSIMWLVWQYIPDYAKIDIKGGVFNSVSFERSVKRYLQDIIKQPIKTTMYRTNEDTEGDVRLQLAVALINNGFVVKSEVSFICSDGDCRVDLVIYKNNSIWRLIEVKRYIRQESEGKLQANNYSRKIGVKCDVFCGGNNIKEYVELLKSIY